MVVRFGRRPFSFLFSDFLSLFAVNNDYIFVVVMVWSAPNHCWSSSTMVWWRSYHCCRFRLNSMCRPLWRTINFVIVFAWIPSVARCIWHMVASLKNAAVLFARTENCSAGLSARNTSVSSMFSQSAGFRPLRRAIRTPDCHVVRTLSIFQRAAELFQTSKCVCQQLSIRRASSTPQDFARNAAEVNLL